MGGGRSYGRNSFRCTSCMNLLIGQMTFTGHIDAYYGLDGP